MITTSDDIKLKWREKEIKKDKKDSYVMVDCPYCRKKHLCKEIDYLVDESKSLMWCDEVEDHFR